MSLLAVLVTHAAETNLSIVTGIPGPLNPEKAGLLGFIQNGYLFALAIAGLLAVGSITYGAIQYTVSRGNPSKLSDAWDRITQALIGILLLVGAGTILTVVNPGLLSLELPQLAPVSGTPFSGDTYPGPTPVPPKTEPGTTQPPLGSTMFLFGDSHCTNLTPYFTQFATAAKKTLLPSACAGGKGISFLTRKTEVINTLKKHPDDIYIVLGTNDYAQCKTTCSTSFINDVKALDALLRANDAKKVTWITPPHLAAETTGLCKEYEGVTHRAMQNAGNAIAANFSYTTFSSWGVALTYDTCGAAQKGRFDIHPTRTKNNSTGYTAWAKAVLGPIPTK